MWERIAQAFSTEISQRTLSDKLIAFWTIMIPILFLIIVAIVVSCISAYVHKKYSVIYEAKMIFGRYITRKVKKYLKGIK